MRANIGNCETSSANSAGRLMAMGRARSRAALLAAAPLVACSCVLRAESGARGLHALGLCAHERRGSRAGERQCRRALPPPPIPPPPARRPQGAHAQRTRERRICPAPAPGSPGPASGRRAARRSADPATASIGGRRPPKVRAAAGINASAATLSLAGRGAPAETIRWRLNLAVAASAIAAALLGGPGHW